MRAEKLAHSASDHLLDDDETAVDESQVTVNDYTHLIEDGEDDTPGDRRRDPLRN